MNSPVTVIAATRSASSARYRPAAIRSRFTFHPTFRYTTLHSLASVRTLIRLFAWVNFNQITL